MKSIDTFFSDFLSKIRLTSNQKGDLKNGHRTLRDRLNAHEDLSTILISTFLQGSYRRATAIKPKNGKRADVDVIVVTNLNEEIVTPDEAMNKFASFLEKYYKGKYTKQGRSISIELSYVDLDIVITSAPSLVDQTKYKSKSIITELSLDDFNSNYPWRLVEGWNEPDLNSLQRLSESLKASTEWKLDPLRIPDRDAKKWEDTHPLEQIRWTREKNANTHTHYVNVVKAIKWWKHVQLSDLKYPKGYPLEHMIGDNCPDNINSIAEGVVKTFENIVTNYSYYRSVKTVPILHDRGVVTHNVWKRITPDEFATFYDSVKAYAKLARKAFDAETLKDKVNLWGEIFGSEFPEWPKEDKSSPSDKPPFTERNEISKPGGSRFA